MKQSLQSGDKHYRALKTDMIDRHEYFDIDCVNVSLFKMIIQLFI